MKKIMMLVVALFMTFLSTSNLYPEMAVKRMGGFKSMTSQGPNKPIKVKCGNDDEKICYKLLENGDLVVGQPVNVWICEDPTNEFNGIGYNNAIFQGYFDGIDPESGIIFDKTTNTIETTNYNDWYNYPNGN